MTKFRVWLRFGLGELVVFGMLHSLLCVVLCALLQRPGWMLPSLLLMLPWAAMGLVRALVPSAALLFLAHGVLAAVPVLLPLPPAGKAVFTVFLVLLAAASLYMRLAAERTERENRETYGRGTQEDYEKIKGDGAGFHIGAAMAIGACAVNVALATLIAPQLGGQLAEPALTLWVPVYIACWVVITQTQGLDMALEHQTKKARQPLGYILRLDNVLLLLFLGLLLLAAFAAPLLPMDEVVAGVGAALLAALRALVRLLAWLFPGGEAVEEEMLEEAVAAPAPAMPQEAAETARIWEILEAILGPLAVAGIVALMLWGLYRFYLRFRGARGPAGGDVREFVLPPFAADAAKRLFGRGGGRRAAFGTGQAARVRKRYFRAVKRGIKRGAKVSATQTTGEIQAELAGQEGLDALTAQYNTARYGPGDA